MAPDGVVKAKISHLIFDMDGLLLDTERFYSIAQQKVLDPFNKEFTWELKAKVMGLKPLESAQVILRHLDLEGKIEPADFLAQRDAILVDLFTQSQPLPGVVRLIDHLHKHGIPIAVGTSSPPDLYAVKIQHHGDLFSKFHHVITGNRVSRSKPAPDIFHKAAAFFEPSPAPEHVLVFEDAPAGVTAARVAGMHTCMVPDSQLDKELTKEADQVLTSLEEFVPEEWGLPPFE